MHVGVAGLGLLLDLLERLRADVDGQLLDVVGHRRRRVDREVHDDVGAERLAELDRRRRCGAPAGASDTSDASSMSSGRMPSTIVRPSKPRRPGRAARTSAGTGSRNPPSSTTERRRRRRSSVASSEVHRRRADEAGDEQVDRVLVQRLRGVDLLEHALAHDGDPVAHRHRLGLVVGDVDRRDAEVVLDAGDLGPHLHAQLGVEVRQRLVHQERLRVAHDGPAHRDPLALAAGQRLGLAGEQSSRPRMRAASLHPLVDLGLRHLLSLRPNAMLSNTLMCG